MWLLADLAAMFLVLPTLLLDLRAMAMPRAQPSGLMRLFRRCDAWLAHRLSMISYLALTYRLVRLGYAIARSGWHPGLKSAAIAGLVVIAAGLVQPLTAVYNALAALVWRNPPIVSDGHRYFPARARLEEPSAFAAIREETERVVARAHPFGEIYRNVTVVEPLQTPAEGWRSFHLRIADRDIVENHARMPATSALLRTMPEVCNAFVSIVDGQHRLAPHRGYFKGILRYHLGILVPEPEEAVLVCGGERYHWREGEGVVFDDMYVHSVENRSLLPRAVLFLDVRRPVGWLGRLVREPLAWLIENHPYHVAARERARR